MVSKRMIAVYVKQPLRPVRQAGYSSRDHPIVIQTIKRRNRVASRVGKRERWEAARAITLVDAMVAEDAGSADEEVLEARAIFR